MAVAIKVPAVGESIVEGTIAHWLKKDGDTVAVDDPLFELETEKATQEVSSQAAGVLHITVKEGETVAIGSVVGRIEPGPGAPSGDNTKKDEKAKPGPGGTPTPAANQSAPPASKPTEQQQFASVAPTRAEAPLSPAVRHLVDEKGLDPNTIPATGRDGRVTKEDVVNFLDQQPAPSPATSAFPTPAAPLVSAPPGPRERRQRMSAIRSRIAERLVQSQQSTATLTTFNEVDMSAVMALRSRYKDTFQKKHGVGLGFLSFFVKACVEGLRAFPLVNSRIDGSDVVTPEYYNIGVAVSTEKGLMVPVLRDVDRLGFAQIEKAIGELAVKARDGKISVNDLQGGTFTITNGGIFGSLVSTPILNPPQSAILGMHSIQKRAVVVEDQIVIRPMMYLALSYDHRLIDGREAVLFLVRVKECVESPERLLLEI